MISYGLDRMTPKRAAGALVVVLLALGTAGAVGADELPQGYMEESRSQAILDKTLEIELAPDLSALSEAEREVVRKLVAVGEIFQRLYENSRHREAVSAHQELLALDRRMGSPRATQNLIDLYYLFKGPIARTLDNDRRAFLPVAPRVPGRNVYPWGVSEDEVESYLDAHPDDKSWLLNVRSVVRRSKPDVIAADIEVIERHSILGVLHPGLKDMLADLLDDPGERAFYALPYSVAYGDALLRAYELLFEASNLVVDEDPEFAGYLRHRARDLLCDDYEAGDAAWVTGKFRNLNAQIGSYEVYDDGLFGVKSFFGLNVLLRDAEQSDALRAAIKGIQRYENALPYEPDGYDGTGNKKNVRDDIPVGVYNVIADFGQSRGTNTATILPNESMHARKYGRTILLRYNIMTKPQLFEIRRDAFEAAVSPQFAGDLKTEGGFYRTLWHEIGHYLGPDRTRNGGDLGEALEAMSSTFEELKADLVSLFLVRLLHQEGYYSDEQRRSVYASGVRRVLLKNQPLRSQSYQTMELMQMNYYLENGLLEVDVSTGKLVIHYDRYAAVVESMLREVMAIQYDGIGNAADAFIDRHTKWDDDLHGRLAQAMKSAEKYRYAMVKYAVLNDD